MKLSDGDDFLDEKPGRILLLFFLGQAATAGQMSQGRPETFLMISLATHALESEFNV